MNHVYRGVRVQDRNRWGDLHTVRCVVTVDGELLPMSELAERKSPTGYEWSYGGSGPAALAHSILAYELGEDIATQVFQDFKWKVIAQLPRDETWTLTSDDIGRWYAQQER